MKKSILFIIIAILSIFLITSCSDDSSNPTGPSSEPTMEKETRSGTLSIPEQSTIQLNELEVTTFAESSDLDQNGNFSVEAPEADKYQILFFMSKISGNPIYLGLYDPLQRSVEANITSTALALTLFNPYLIYSDQVQRSEYLDAIQQNSKFSELLTELETAYQSNADIALDYDTHPATYQLVAQLIQETMEYLGGRNERPIGEPPYIEDAEGADITFVSPRFVWYAAGIHPNGNELSDVVSVKRKETILSFDWGFPPVVVTEPRETNYELGDGDFEIFVTKDIDFTKITQWDDPVGRATILNTGQSILYIIELIIGNLPTPNLATLPNHINITSGQAIQLGLDIAQGHPQEFLMHFCDLLASNSESIAYWIWQETQANAAHQFLSTATHIFKNISFVLRLLGYANEQGPFFFDLVFAPEEITYFITQENGVITSTEINDPPVAEFSVNPPAGIIEIEFTFDASQSYDDNDNLNELDFRWDWESDGDFDTSWSSNYIANHTYYESGSYNITLEVRDSGELTSSVVHILNVGGGAGSATHVKLFRDNLPWESNAMVDMLQSLGFSEGIGENTYEIITSDQFSTVPLIPGEDLIIISNDQNQTFYNNYATSQTRFTNFVYMGGSMFWEACDEGWAEGSIIEAGIVLPGNLITDFDYDYWNYVTDQNLPLVSGLPDAMDHNYASHESFSNLPDGTTIYCVNEEDEATLVEFNLGAGWIIVSGQPLEHQYEHIYGSPDMEELLPRIASYFTGQIISRGYERSPLLKSTRASH